MDPVTAMPDGVQPLSMLVLNGHHLHILCILTWYCRMVEWLVNGRADGRMNE
jgi:hypothetical protein